MPVDRISILAIDAVDYRLAEEFGCENLLLDKHSKLETESWSAEHPSTKEIWPSVATGVTPDKHGLVLSDDSGEKDIGVEFSNPLIKFARKFKWIVPLRFRKDISHQIRSNTEVTLEQTNHDHMLDEVYMWPGLSPATHLTRSHNLLKRVLRSELSERELKTETLDLTLDEFGWLATVDGDVTGVHSHILDVAGHVYCNQRDGLREYYERVDALVAWLRTECDELVILSDHGMQVGWLGDDDPGQHSWEAMVSATDCLNGLPDSIYDVREWIESHRITGRASDAQADLDSTEEQLKSLGYM